MQNTGINFPGMNQQGIYGQNNFGQDPYFFPQQPQNPQQLNPCVSNFQSSVGCNPCLCTPGVGQAHMTPCGNILAQNILEQIRSCVGNPSPIFILPNAQPAVAQNPSAQIHPGYQNTNYPSLPQNQIFTPPSYPIQMPTQFWDPLINQNRFKPANNCNCQTNSSTTVGNDFHRCSPGINDTICTKINCPASINLQALASQLLSLQGVIPCAATRLLLKKIPGSNVTTSPEETIERAQKSIGLLNKEQLINEARNAQQVNGIINLHMSANPPQNIIPILTMLQLKVNSLKSLVENLVNKLIGECQSVGVDGNTNLEGMMLSLKSDAEIRDLLAHLRQTECEERVNVNYAPYHSQKIVAESRLANIQNKINQVESEMERRRSVATPWAAAGQFHQTGGNSFSNPPGFRSNQISNSHQVFDPCAKNFESPSPFMVQLNNPKRLNLKPNVCGPKTTEEETPFSPEAFAVSKLNKDSKGSENEDKEPSKDAADLVKKKLRIHIDNKGELSVKKQSLEGFEISGGIVQLSPEVVIVIDKELNDTEDGTKNLENKNKQIKESKKSRNKSPESIASDSTFDSETSISSSEVKDLEKRKKGKPGLRNILKGKKKTPMNQEDSEKSLNRSESDYNNEQDILSMKKNEKHVSVAMFSKQSCNPFVEDQDTKIFESESAFVSEDSKKITSNNDDNFSEKVFHDDSKTNSEKDKECENNRNLKLEDENKRENSLESLQIFKEQNCSIVMKKNDKENQNLKDSLSSLNKNYRGRPNSKLK